MTGLNIPDSMQKNLRNQNNLIFRVFGTAPFYVFSQTVSVACTVFEDKLRVEL
jgi:hypothetical protein